MTEEARKEFDAFEMLMQDHREVESLFREFEYLQQNRGDTGHVIASACAELKLHDTLEAGIFYAAAGEAADDEATERRLGEAEVEHVQILELIEKLEQTAAGSVQRDACFTALAGHVKHHVLKDETERFPLVKRLARFDLDALTVAMKKRKTELFTEADEETV